MALTSTIGTFFLPFQDPQGAVTPTFVEALQTSGNGATSGMYLIASSATASGDTYLVALHVDVEEWTATAQIDVMFDEVTIGGIQVSDSTTAGGTKSLSYYFGEIGLVGGTTTTNSVYLNCKGATSSVIWTCRFNRAT